MVKRSSNPIPEKSYERFKYKIEEKSGKFAERNIMLFLLGVATGYRMGDLVGLTIGDIRESLVNGEFEIQESKAYEDWKTNIIKYPKSIKKPPVKRKHKIRPRLEKLLKAYIKDKKKSEYAFASNKGKGSKHIKAPSFSDFLKEISKDKEINLKHITGHSLRKTYARRIYEATGSLEETRVALGHKNIEVTKVYLGLEEETKEKSADIADNKI